MRKGCRLLFTVVLLVILPFVGNVSYADDKTAMTPQGLLYGSPETFAEFHGFITLTYYDFETDGTRGGD